MAASALVDENRTALIDTYTRMARLVADLPKLKAAVATGDAPTVQPLADEYLAELNADFLLLEAEDQARLGVSGAVPDRPSAEARDGAPLEERATLSVHSQGLAQIISVPILLDGEVPDILGRLTVGYLLDRELAQQLRRLTGSEIAFGAGGRVLASSLPDASHATLATMLTAREIANADLGGEEFIGLAHPLQPYAAALSGDAAPVALVLRSRTERLRFLSTIRTGLLGALVVTLLLATLVSYAVARTVTRPLSAITRAMREVAATGDLTRKVTLHSGRRDDADARLLASSFNTLTDSIARFQADAAQKDRLSALGRLSTVIAHEIRNPLMIIKASLCSLRGATPESERVEAVADIEEEADRINRIVSDVLDFAKPLQFQLADADLNDICLISAMGAWAGDFEQDLQLELDESLPPVMVDAERLRMALINLLTNARHATAEAPRPAITLSTSRHGARAAIAVRDRGIGISPEDLEHIFDPYFTTRRTGTGLGLPIARNIIEGLRGTIAVTSEPGHGTEIRIELPLAPPKAAA